MIFKTSRVFKTRIPFLLSTLFKEKYWELILCLLSAGLISFFGNSSRYLILITQKPIVIQLLATCILTALFIEYLNWVKTSIPAKNQSGCRLSSKLVIQLFIGISIPGLLDYGLLLIYKWYFGINQISVQSDPEFSFSVLMLPILFINLYYLVYFQMKKNESKEHKSKSSELFLISQGVKTIPINTKEMAYLYIENRICYLITKNNKKYFLNTTLEELEHELDPEVFFRVNRKMIIHFMACIQFQSDGKGRLILGLTPPYKDEVRVGIGKSKKFIKWINR